MAPILVDSKVEQSRTGMGLIGMYLLQTVKTEFKEATPLLWLNVVACLMLEFMTTMEG